MKKACTIPGIAVGSNYGNCVCVWDRGIFFLVIKLINCLILTLVIIKLLLENSVV